MTVANVHLAALSGLYSPKIFLNALPILSKLELKYNHYDHRGLVEFVDLIVPFMQKYHAVMGDPKLLLVEGNWRNFPEEAMIGQVQEIITCQFAFRTGTGHKASDIPERECCAQTGTA